MNTDGNSLIAADPNDWQRARVERGLVKFASVMPISTFVGGVAIVVYLWPVIPRNLLAGWFNAAALLSVALCVAGRVLNGRWTRLTSATDRRMRRRLVLLSSLVTGVFWGVTGILLLPGSPLYQSFLALILAGVTALWLPLFALDRRTLLTLAAPALLPMALALLAPPSPATAPLATMGSLLLLQLTAFVVVAQMAKRLLDADCATQSALYRQATHDALVGVANQAEFRRCLAVLDSVQSGSYALVFIDLDNFKDVNDTAGHAAGDRLLAEIGSILREEKRKCDVAARVGGDEFALLMDLCSDRDALRVACAVARRIEELELEHEGWRLRVTASIGIACGGADRSSRDVLDAADQACYRAKRAGRNRIELAAELPAARTVAQTADADARADLPDTRAPAADRGLATPRRPGACVDYLPNRVALPGMR